MLFIDTVNQSPATDKGLDADGRTLNLPQCVLDMIEVQRKYTGRQARKHFSTQHTPLQAHTPLLKGQS